MAGENRDNDSFQLSSISEAIQDVAAGKIVIVVDDENRENEGDLFVAAELCSAEHMNFFIKNARGLVCVPLEQEIAERLGLDLMVEKNTDLHGTAFTVSVDAREGTTTGISAEDRAVTAKILASPSSKPGDLRRPGHIFPLIAREGGVLKRAGHTEAAVDLSRFAGFSGVGVICEIMNEDGTMARMPDLIEFAKKYGFKMISVADLIRHRLRAEKLVSRDARVDLPTRYGNFQCYAYRYRGDQNQDLVHLALVKGEVYGVNDVLVRVHSECLTGDLFGSLRCDCGQQLHASMEMIEKEGRGVLVYLRQEGRGIGLLAKLKAYELQDSGLDTEEANIALGFPPDLRDYGVGAQILLDLGINRFRLITNNPRKIIGLQGYGLSISGRVPMEFPPTPYNERYLHTKHEKMGHILHV